MQQSALIIGQCEWSSPPFAELLICDDSLFDRKRILREARKVEGHYNFTEADCLEGLKRQLTMKRFDLILVDYALADGEGLDAVSDIDASAINADAFRVMITGYDSPVLEANALQAGFDEYLSKNDVHLETLSHLLFAAVQKSRDAGAWAAVDLVPTEDSTADIEDSFLRRLVRSGMPQEDKEPFSALGIDLPD